MIIFLVFFSGGTFEQKIMENAHEDRYSISDRHATEAYMKRDITEFCHLSCPGLTGNRTRLSKLGDICLQGLKIDKSS